MTRKQDETPQDLYSLRQLASILKVDRNRLAGKVRAVESFPGPNRSRLYSLAAVEGLLGADSDPALDEARRRKLLAEAELAELKLGRERGELLEQRCVQGRLIAVFRAFRTRLCVTWPLQLAAQLHRAESAEQVGQVLRLEAERMMGEFRRDHLRFIDEAGGAAPGGDAATRGGDDEEEEGA